MSQVFFLVVVLLQFLMLLCGPGSVNGVEPDVLEEVMFSDSSNDSPGQI